MVVAYFAGTEKKMRIINERNGLTVEITSG